LGQQESRFWDFYLGVSGEKWHLGVVLAERHIVYYREGSGASSQRLWDVWSLCLRLSLLSLPHHFHSTYINHFLFLVVWVDHILNSHLWIRPSPILEYQHAPLTPEVLRIREHASTFFFFFHCFIISLGAHHFHLTTQPLVVVCNGIVSIPIFSLLFPKLQPSSLTPLVFHPMISLELSYPWTPYPHPAIFIWTLWSSAHYLSCYSSIFICFDYTPSRSPSPYPIPPIIIPFPSL
jgi:hypothetical protein